MHTAADAQFTVSVAGALNSVALKKKRKRTLKEDEIVSGICCITVKAVRKSFGPHGFKDKVLTVSAQSRNKKRFFHYRYDTRIAHGGVYNLQLKGFVCHR